MENNEANVSVLWMPHVWVSTRNILSRLLISFLFKRQN